MQKISTLLIITVFFLANCTQKTKESSSTTSEHKNVKFKTNTCVTEKTIQLLESYIDLRKTNRIKNRDIGILQRITHKNEYCHINKFLQESFIKQNMTLKNDSLRVVFSEPTTEDILEKKEHEGYWLKIVNPYAGISISISIEHNKKNENTKLSFKQFSIQNLTDINSSNDRYKAFTSGFPLVKTEDKTINLNEKEWLNASSKIHKSGFWSIAKLDNDFDYTYGYDHVYYILEGFRPKTSMYEKRRYNLLEKYEAFGDPFFEKITTLLLSLSGKNEKDLNLVAGRIKM